MKLLFDVVTGPRHTYLTNTTYQLGATTRLAHIIMFQCLCVRAFSSLSCKQRLLDDVEIIECDWETAEPIRGKDGKCVIVPKGILSSYQGFAPRDTIISISVQKRNLMDLNK